MAVAAMSQPQAAAKLFLEGVTAIQSCRQPKVVLEALMELSPQLGRFDPGRAKYLLGLAADLADKLKNPVARKQIDAAIAKLSGKVAPTATNRVHVHV
jgi:hypothetical protein